MCASVERDVGIYGRRVRIPAGNVFLEGDISLPPAANSLVVFAHGSGSSRHSPRNRLVASELAEGGLGTLLMDLLTEEEDRDYSTRFDINLLTERLIAAVDWCQSDESLGTLSIGLFGSSTGAAAALKAAAVKKDRVRAVVSRGGRPDLAGPALNQVECPTLFIVGGADYAVLPLNRSALEQLSASEKELQIVPNATHLFEEPGALEQVARHSLNWFKRYCERPAQAGG